MKAIRLQFAKVAASVIPMKLNEMRQILADHRIQLTKSLGQNFLHDGQQLERIVNLGEIIPTDRVLEIGPGLGPLTERLLERGVPILAIEKDGRLVEVLRTRLGHFPQLTLLHADALDHVRDHPTDWSDWKLVSNLPYSVASPILVELAKLPQCPERLVATLQLEVARRLMAGHDTDDYGVLTLLLQLRYQPEGWFKIPSGCFFPEPEVDSACVQLIRRKVELLPRALHLVYERIVKLGFSQRRKMMFKLLKQNWPEERLKAAFETVGLSLQIRAEKVSLKQFVQLTQLLQPEVLPKP
jgi:16S rRNA (adenine1518-N6/adenine1519-N6)-dimethyltransferase